MYENKISRKDYENWKVFIKSGLMEEYTINRALKNW